jgi:hypothetical protein
MPATATKEKADKKADDCPVLPRSPEQQRIEELEREVKGLRGEVDHHRHHRKRLRELIDQEDVLKEQLSSVKAQEKEIAGRWVKEDWQPTLFDGKAAKGKPKPSKNGTPVAPEGNDAWKAMEVGTLQQHGTSLGITLAMGQNDIATLGDLSDRMNSVTVKGLPNWWAGFKGIGEKKAEQVEQAFSAFWASHPEFCKDPPKPAEAKPSEPAKETTTDDVVKALAHAHKPMAAK